jgi:hypothetical protein
MGQIRYTYPGWCAGGGDDENSAQIHAKLEGLAPMSDDEPVETTSAAARTTPDKVVALMNAAIAAARAEGITVPPDLARKTFAVTRKLAALARRRDPG